MIDNPLEAMAEYTRMRRRIDELERTVGILRASCPIACHSCAGTGYGPGMTTPCEPCGGGGRHTDEVTNLASSVALLKSSEVAYLEKIALLSSALTLAERRVAELEGEETRGMVPNIPF